MKRNLIYPGKKHFNGRYYANTKGRVFKTDGSEVNYHPQPSGGTFVRICGGKQRMATISTAKLVLLCFDPKGYKKGLIALHLDGDIFNNKPSNLKWGTRRDQVFLSMNNPEIKKRIYNMARKYHGKL